MLLVGIIMSLFYEALIFILVYSLLRKYTGGYHSSNNKYCLLISCLVMVIAMLIVKVLYTIKFNFIFYMIIIILSIIISVLTPVDDINKPFEDIEIQIYGIKSRLLVLVFVIISFLLTLFRIDYYETIIVAFLITASMLLLGIKKSPRFKRIRSRLKTHY
jgi:accessory gene regulator B